MRSSVRANPKRTCWAGLCECLCRAAWTPVDCWTGAAARQGKRARHGDGRLGDARFGFGHVDRRQIRPSKIHRNFKELRNQQTITIHNQHWTRHHPLPALLDFLRQLADITMQQKKQHSPSLLLQVQGASNGCLLVAQAS
jgi:hypothetical protein